MFSDETNINKYKNSLTKLHWYMLPKYPKNSGRNSGTSISKNKNNRQK